MQQWFALSDPAMEAAIYGVPLYHEFAALDDDMALLLDETTVLRFRHLFDEHGMTAQILALVKDVLGGKALLLKTGSVVDAALLPRLDSRNLRNRFT
jgi:transposase, IS5 family